MAENKQKKSILPKRIIDRINNLVLERMLKNLYLSFDENRKKEMSDIFTSGKKKDKDDFVRDNFPNFELLFEEEVKKLSEEIKTEMATAS